MGKVLIIKGADFSTNAVETLPIITDKVLVSCTASPTQGGTFSGTGYYDKNSSATVTAIPNANFAFVKWQDNNSTSTTRTVQVGTENISLTGIFESTIVKTHVTPYTSTSSYTTGYSGGTDVIWVLTTIDGQSAWRQYIDGVTVYCPAMTCTVYKVNVSTEETTLIGSFTCDGSAYDYDFPSRVTCGENEYIGIKLGSANFTYLADADSITWRNDRPTQSGINSILPYNPYYF